MATAANSPALPARWRPRKRLWAALAFALAITAVLGAISEWRDDHAFLINTSDSLPNWAFVIHRNRSPEPGAYVFFDPPATGLVHRHFGAKPHMFGKIVYGMPGDLVSHTGPIVTINGRAVAHMKPLTRLGEALTPGTVGPVPQGCYFVGTPHPDGFDSRYAEIGFVCRKQIIGTGEPIL